MARALFSNVENARKKWKSILNKIEFTDRTHRGVKAYSDISFNSFYFLKIFTGGGDNGTRFK